MQDQTPRQSAQIASHSLTVVTVRGTEGRCLRPCNTDMNGVPLKLPDSSGGGLAVLGLCGHRPSRPHPRRVIATPVHPHTRRSRAGRRLPRSVERSEPAIKAFVVLTPDMALRPCAGGHPRTLRSGPASAEWAEDGEPSSTSTASTPSPTQRSPCLLPSCPRGQISWYPAVGRPASLSQTQANVGSRDERQHD